MTIFSKAALFTLCSVLAGSALAAQAAPELKGCAAKQQSVQTQLQQARANGNKGQQAGLETALAEIKANCNDTALQKSRENKVLEAKREVSQRQADLDKAMKRGDAERINKRKDKLAESRKELQQALDELDR